MPSLRVTHEFLVRLRTRVTLEFSLKRTSRYVVPLYSALLTATLYFYIDIQTMDFCIVLYVGSFPFEVLSLSNVNDSIWSVSFPRIFLLRILSTLQGTLSLFSSLSRRKRRGLESCNITLQIMKKFPRKTFKNGASFSNILVYFF